jgi:hypothetical protein
MDEPSRFTRRPANDPAGELLRAMRDDAPGPGARRAALIALGLAAGATATTAAVSSVAATKAASMSVGASAAATVAKGAVGSLLIAKWIAVGAIGGALTIGAIKVVEHRSGPTERTTAAEASGVAVAAGGSVRRADLAPQRAQAAPHASTIASSGPAEVRAVLPETRAAMSMVASTDPPAVSAAVSTEEPRAEDAGVQPPMGAAAPIASGPGAGSQPTLTDEVAALDQARSALAAGNGPEALRLLEAYRTGFPRQQLEAEATVMRVEALIRMGDRAQASRVADAFVASHPRSPLVPHVRRLLGDKSGSSDQKP